MPPDGTLRWQDMTSAEARSLGTSDVVAILPLAAIEQHGAHLPLSTDLEIGAGILDAALGRLPPAFPVRVLPPQAVGASLEHMRLPGTLSLPSGLLAEVILRLGEALASSGVRRLLLHNAHGGNRGALDDAALRLRSERGLLVVKSTYTRFPRPDGLSLPEAEWRHGLHGGAVETSMMLHLRPDLVRGDGTSPSHPLGRIMEEEGTVIGPEGAAAFAWLAGDLHSSGVAGDPALASPTLGARLVEHYAEILARVILEIRAFPLERLA